MPELPSSWNLRTELNSKGTLDVIGKDDTGKDYRVRITDHSEITERDVQEIKAADRESTTAREFCDGIIRSNELRRNADEAAFEADLMEGADHIVRVGFGVRSFGYSRAYARGYEEVFGK